MYIFSSVTAGVPRVSRALGGGLRRIGKTKLFTIIVQGVKMGCRDKKHLGWNGVILVDVFMQCLEKWFNTSIFFFIKTLTIIYLI